MSGPSNSWTLTEARHGIILPAQAQVVIIGGGVGGCSIAYHLTLMGWTDVVVLERGELTCGSTWHSAGLVGQLRSDFNLTRMMKYSTDLYRKLKDETGQDTGWREVGGLRLASSPERMEELKRQVGYARSFGMPLELVSTARSQEALPADESGGRAGRGAHPDRRLHRPDRADDGTGGRRQDRGAQIFTDTNVTGIKLKNGAWTR